jgi:hypothetical protein
MSDAAPASGVQGRRRGSIVVKAVNAIVPAVTEYMINLQEAADEAASTIEAAEAKLVEHAKVIGVLAAGAATYAEYTGPGLGSGPVSKPLCSAIAHAVTVIAKNAPGAVSAIASNPFGQIFIAVSVFKWLIADPLVAAIQDALDKSAAAAAEKERYEKELLASIEALEVDSEGAAGEGGRRRKRRGGGGFEDVDKMVDELLEKMKTVNWKGEFEKTDKELKLGLASFAPSAKGLASRRQSTSDAAPPGSADSMVSQASNPNGGRRRSTRRHRRHRLSAPTRKARSSSSKRRRYTHPRRG